MGESVDEGRRASPPAKADLPPRLTVNFNDEGTLEIGLDGDVSDLLRATGNIDVMKGLAVQMAKLGTQGKRADEEASNFALGLVESMAPRDAAEALLVTQMAAIHQATMGMARRLNHVETLPQQDSIERALNKLARTYATQMDTLKRYRSKGQQTVRVERVTVEDGGQAIVGNVETGGRGCDEV